MDCVLQRDYLYKLMNELMRLRLLRSDFGCVDDKVWTEKLAKRLVYVLVSGVFMTTLKFAKVQVKCAIVV